MKVDNKIHDDDPKDADKESEKNGDSATNVEKSIRVHGEYLSRIGTALKIGEVGEHWRRRTVSIDRFV